MAFLQPSVIFKEDFQMPRADPSWRQVPLSFSVVAHNNLAVLSHLLRLLFRPRHAFCLHVDAKAPQEFKDAVEEMVDCYR